MLSFHALNIHKGSPITALKRGKKQESRHKQLYNKGKHLFSVQQLETRQVFMYLL